MSRTITIIRTKIQEVRYLKNENDRRRDSEQVDLEGGEPKTLEDKSEISSWRSKRDQESEADNVERPHIVIRERSP